MQAVGAFFKGARQANGWKPEEVALKMAVILGEPVSPSTVYKIEGNRMNPGLDLVLALLRVLNVDPRALLSVALDTEMSLARAGEVGSKSTSSDTAWLDELTPAERERAERFFSEHD